MPAPQGLTRHRNGTHYVRAGSGFSQEHLLKGEDGRLHEARLVRDQVRGQIRVGRCPCRAFLFRDYFDLLADPALHDDVVTIEAEAHAFPVQDLIAYVRLDQVAQLGGGWFAALRCHVLGHEVVHHPLGDDDAAPGGVAGRPPLIAREERDADQQEVQGRLAGEAFERA